MLEEYLLYPRSQKATINIEEEEEEEEYRLVGVAWDLVPHQVAWVQQIS